MSPTHYVPQLLEALYIAHKRGLQLPVVYNSSGYDSTETLSLLDGIVDIYLPDMKYGINRLGKKYSGIPDYWDVSRRAIEEMYRQVGPLEKNRFGVARQGLLKV